MAHPIEKVNKTRKYPFVHMRIADHSVLDTIEGRHICELCNRSRKFFCYNCCIPVGNIGNILPQVEIPVYIDIIKHKKEIDGKSTAVHAVLLAKDRVRIFTYPDIPDYKKEKGVFLIFPGAKSLTVPQIFDRKIRLMTENNYGRPKGHNIGTMLRWRVEEVIEENDAALSNDSRDQFDFDNLPVKRAIFIDSTWNQSRGIYKDPRVNCLPTIVLQNRYSQFWRHQHGSPRWYLATIEAVHQFLLEVHVNAWGLNKYYRGLDNLEISQGFHDIARLVEAKSSYMDRYAPYNGQYDNLMYFFANMYDLIHKYYDHNELKSYRRPI